jgi:hypothetical protein
MAGGGSNKPKYVIQVRGESFYNLYETDFLLPSTFIACCLTEPLRLPCKTAPSRSRPTSGRISRVFILSSTVLLPSSWEKSERWLSKSSSELLIAAATSASSGNRVQCHPRWLRSLPKLDMESPQKHDLVVPVMRDISTSQTSALSGYRPFCFSSMVVSRSGQTSEQSAVLAKLIGFVGTERGSGQIDRFRRSRGVLAKFDRFVSSRDGHEAFGLAPIDVPVLLVDDKYMASHGRNHNSMMMTFVTETLQKKAKTGCPVHRPTLELNRA